MTRHLEFDRSLPVLRRVVEMLIDGTPAKVGVVTHSMRYLLLSDKAGKAEIKHY